MTTTEILAAFANPETMKSLGISDTLYAGLVTTVLGMGITFTALIVLLFVMALMDKMLNNRKEEGAVVAPAPQPASPPAIQANKDDGELIAAITTAIAMSLRTSTSNIIVRNIEKVEETTPQWNKAGIIEQMNSRF